MNMLGLSMVIWLSLFCFVTMAACYQVCLGAGGSTEREAHVKRGCRRCDSVRVAERPLWSPGCFGTRSATPDNHGPAVDCVYCPSGVRKRWNGNHYWLQLLLCLSE